MKLRFLFLIIFSNASLSYGQARSPLVSTWKVIAFSDGTVTCNLKSDSCFFSDQGLIEYPDLEERKSFAANSRRIFGSQRFSFSKDGYYRQFLDSVIAVAGRYQDLGTILKIITPNASGQEVAEVIPYEIRDGLLYISITLSEDLLRFTLEKEK